MFYGWQVAEVRAMSERVDGGAVHASTLRPPYPAAHALIVILLISLSSVTG